MNEPRRKIALDYDGVIVDTNRAKAHWIEMNLGLRIPPGRCNRTECVPRIGITEYERMAKVVYGEQASLEALPVRGAQKVIGALSRHWGIYVLTQRDDERVKWATYWLEQNGLDSFIQDVIAAGDTPKLSWTERIGARAILDDDIRHLATQELVEADRYHFAPSLRISCRTDGPIFHVRTWHAFATCMSLAGELSP